MCVHTARFSSVICNATAVAGMRAGKCLRFSFSMLFFQVQSCITPDVHPAVKGRSPLEAKNIWSAPVCSFQSVHISCRAAVASSVFCSESTLVVPPLHNVAGPAKNQRCASATVAQVGRVLQGFRVQKQQSIVFARMRLCLVQDAPPPFRRIVRRVPRLSRPPEELNWRDFPPLRTLQQLRQN